MSYINKTTNDDYPKSLLIRNTPGGLIWQVYTVQKESEAINLSANATSNGFYGITLEDFDACYAETFPGWRETDGGKNIINR